MATDLIRHPGWAIALTIILIRVLIRVVRARRIGPPPQKLEWSEGGLYSIEAEEGRYAVAKVLKLDEHGVHIRMYSNRFDTRPTDVDPEALYMTSLKHSPGEHPGIGHLPMSRASFRRMNALLTKLAHLDATELTGYNLWRDAGGGYFECLPNAWTGGEKERSRLPEVLGHVSDDQGQRHELHRGWIKHGSLSEEQGRRVARLREVLAEAYPMTMEGWIDGFLRDRDPESEIRIIEACAVAYQRLASQARLSPEEKKRLYSVLCALSCGGTGPQLASALPPGKGLPDLEGVASMYREAHEASLRP
jgi:hypothetical protein